MFNNLEYMRGIMRIQAIRNADNQIFCAQFNEKNQEKFMKLAQGASGKSTCRRAQTGAVVVTPKGKVVGEGFNAVPTGVSACQVLNECPRVTYNIPSGLAYEDSCRSIHAEVNAIKSAGKNKANKGTLFLFGHFHLCGNCQLNTINAGIEDVYVQHKAGDVIKHFSIGEIIKSVNENYKNGLEKLAKTVIKSV